MAAEAWSSWLSGFVAFEPVPVRVHIYDIGEGVAPLNELGRVFGTGAFHAAVEVHGREWSFCARPCAANGTGVYCVLPRCNRGHVYRETLEMGSIWCSQREVYHLLDQLMREWHFSTYDFLRRNCCHFSNELCRRLGLGDLPPWVTSLAGAGEVFEGAAGHGALYGLATHLGSIGEHPGETAISVLTTPVAVVAEACEVGVGTAIDLIKSCATPRSVSRQVSRQVC